MVDNDEYTQGLVRMVEALGRRVGAGDPDELVYVKMVRKAADRALSDAVHQLRAHGFNDGAIARELGVTRQAVQKRWPARCERTGAGARYVDVSAV